MKILVTGATGGLGIALVQYFVSRGYETIATGRNELCGQKLVEMGAKFIPCDLRNPRLIFEVEKGIDFIVHSAAISSPWGHWHDFFEINYLATQKILKLAKENGVKGLVFVSSPSVYARAIDQIGLNETDAPNPRPLNHYAKTKLMAEKIVLDANEENFRASIIRPRAIIGPNDSVLLPRFLRLINKGRFPLFNNGDAIIEPTDVRDVAHAIGLMVTNSNSGGEIFNISGGKSKKFNEMISELSIALHKKVSFVKINYNTAFPVIGFVEWFCSILPKHPEPPITKYSLAVLSFSQTFDLTKARKILGFEPQFDAFETAIEIAKSLEK